MAPLDIETFQDPQLALDSAAPLLRHDPVGANEGASVLHEAAAQARPATAWLARDGGVPTALAVQTPGRPVNLAPMPDTHARRIAQAVAAHDSRAPGVRGPAGAAAAFAGAWLESVGRGAQPVEGRRLWRLPVPGSARPAPGKLRRAAPSDGGDVVGLMEGFLAETGEDPVTATGMVGRRLGEGRYLLWEDGGPVTVVGVTPPVFGVVRVQAVFTPQTLRNRGYAAAAVAELSARVLLAGNECVLITNLANPVPNRLFLGLGFQPVLEAVEYRFATAEPE
ncbi:MULTISPECIES: GNAT family N-acetyltransferase [unclassified Phenylobacterium]|uniref:GNAT family N-acetyltransferase n=1 Tax=unclassified Phenylobacterium TaxID=2640670 RepID=UPI00083A5A3C|nr:MULTISPECIES: GNAT family N-acetyltransferase [unclassified Phenylobacterium]